MRLFRKIKNKLKSTVVPTLIKTSVALNWPALTARILVATTQRLNRSGQYTVLCLRRSVFIDDIWAMIKYSGKIKYLAIERMYFTIILAYFLSAQERKEITENNYHTTSIGQAGKKKYYHYLEQMFPILKKKLKFQAVASGNFGYVQQQELMRLCRENKIPFVVLHKEGTIAGFFHGANDIYLGRKFLGDRLLIYNQKILGALLGKVSDLAPDQIRLVGVPRLDHYHKHQAKVLPQITFFSFYIENWLPKIAVEKKNYEAARARARDFNAWVLHFAANHPKINIIVKTKAAGFYQDYVKEIFTPDILQKHPNVILHTYGDSTELIQQSRAVLGFNSMALIEALIAGKPIFSPFFGDMVTPGKAWDYFKDRPEFINYVKSESDLEKGLLNPEHSFHKDARVTVAEFVEQFVYHADGNASSRAEQEIINVIEEFSHANS